MKSTFSFKLQPWTLAVLKKWWCRDHYFLPHLPRPLWAGRLTGGRVTGRASPGTTTQRKSPASAQRGYSSTRAAAWTKPQLCSQTILQVSLDPSKFAIREHCSTQPAWIQSLPLVPDLWDLWCKETVFLLPTTVHLRKQQGLPFPGAPLSPGADLDITCHC